MPSSQQQKCSFEAFKHSVNKYSTLKCSVWNVYSIQNKLAEVMEHVLDTESNVIFLTETWLTSMKSRYTADIKEYGFKLLHRIRKSEVKDRGGGVGILIKSTIKARIISSTAYSSFEHNIGKNACLFNK